MKLDKSDLKWALTRLPKKLMKLMEDPDIDPSHRVHLTSMEE